MVIQQQQILLPHYQTPGWSDACNNLLAGCARHIQIKALPCCCNISSSHNICMLQSICKGLNVTASLVDLYHSEPFINFLPPVSIVCHLLIMVSSEQAIGYHVCLLRKSYILSGFVIRQQKHTAAEEQSQRRILSDATSDYLSSKVLEFSQPPVKYLCSCCISTWLSPKCLSLSSTILII